MKRIIAMAAAVLAAGCATQDGAQYARNECKVAPLATASVAGKPRAATSLERRQAEAALATSQYRHQQLHSPYGSNVEEALSDCR